ncbi:unnamed protein product [Acanthoscelides obtectus]|uniref:Uncharacterized protein n=1 Tax=Acanthoscelides obtectus TaxID=200917 RepID=A0A9P0JQP9_ACAOB|nr:unnamed protein product [Acanthoscelides obtectus]CAK1667909.1 hypothetical protein AOBTE_LOCUS26108 [Acanthoscelides obtectus]
MGPLMRPRRHLRLKHNGRDDLNTAKLLPFMMQRTDDSEVVFNNGKWSSYTPQQLKRPKTGKLSCTKTEQNRKYISVNYLLMEKS